MSQLSDYIGGLLGNTIGTPIPAGGWAQMQGMRMPEEMARQQQNLANAWFRLMERERADREIEIHEVRL